MNDIKINRNKEWGKKRTKRLRRHREAKAKKNRVIKTKPMIPIAPTTSPLVIGRPAGLGDLGS